MPHTPRQWLQHHTAGLPFCVHVCRTVCPARFTNITALTADFPCSMHPICLSDITRHIRDPAIAAPSSTHSARAAAARAHTHTHTHRKCKCKSHQPQDKPCLRLTRLTFHSIAHVNLLCSRAAVHTSCTIRPIGTRGHGRWHPLRCQSLLMAQDLLEHLGLHGDHLSLLSQLCAQRQDLGCLA